jgi:hypothetical protein
LFVGAVDEILDRCAGLPLALAIAAIRALTRPAFAIADLAAELRAARGGLDAFSDSDATLDMRAVFSWSCRGLGPDARRMFQLLADQPGPDFTVSAAASVLAVSPARVRVLVAERSPGRYSYHDLLGVYAAELAARVDREERQAALHRLLDHYLHSAHAASAPLYPNADLLSLPPVAADVVVERSPTRTRHYAGSPPTTSRCGRRSPARAVPRRSTPTPARSPRRCRSSCNARGGGTTRSPSSRWPSTPRGASTTPRSSAEHIAVSP